MAFGVKQEETLVRTNRGISTSTPTNGWGWQRRMEENPHPFNIIVYRYIVISHVIVCKSIETEKVLLKTWLKFGTNLLWLNSTPIVPNYGSLQSFPKSNFSKFEQYLIKIHYIQVQIYAQLRHVWWKNNEINLVL